METSRRHILCIDDDKDTCLLLTTWLGFSNCDVTSAFTMKHGIEMAQAKGFDLYLIDSRLPDGTGVETCRKIRRFDPHTPILFWSGDDDATAEAFEAGAQAFFAKPIDPGSFKETLEDLLRRVSTRGTERSLARPL